MEFLTPMHIQTAVADSEIIYRRGERLFSCGGCFCHTADAENGRFVYEVDGNYGDYTIEIQISGDQLTTRCDCPYPGVGCKHTVAALLDINQNNGFYAKTRQPAVLYDKSLDPCLTAEEIRAQAIEDRKKRARTEKFVIIQGDMYKGEHLVETPNGRQYTVTFHDPEKGEGHCSCPDFQTNKLNTCKHLIAAERALKDQKDFKKRCREEVFPFADIFWDSMADRPRVFCERLSSEPPPVQELITAQFDETGLFKTKDLSALMPVLDLKDQFKRVRIQDTVLKKLDEYWADRQLAELSEQASPSLSAIRTRLYAYQEEGIRFAVYKKAALIGDEMGLGKTLQAIAAALVKKEIFGFDRVLVVTLASLKEQWKREIEKFTDEKAVIVAGNAEKRSLVYRTDPALFKITNYEAVLRDTGTIARFNPDLVILDEAQRIKNFATKTADAVKRIPRRHALVLTGTPLENKLEDVYSIIQFLDPDHLSPLWEFAANHFMLSRDKKGKILGYRNLEALHQGLQPLVIRRKKAEVMDELPDEIVNTYYIDLADQQLKIHAGYAQLLGPLINKKFLTPVDLRRIQELLLKMRQVCNTTYLIDRRTNISPKLKELESIMDELMAQDGRKIVVFSEWTTMNFLIAKQLSNAGISFVELSGRIPVNKRQALIDEFTHNPACRVFLSTDAGGTGLNLQAADCVINFELPWNPARMNQRIGRVSRIGQKSNAINVINLIAKNSIEERIYAGIQLKTDLFKGVFDGGADVVEFSNEKRNEMLNYLRALMDEESAPLAACASVPDEIPDDTPHYLNPKVFNEDAAEPAGGTAEPEPVIAYEAEEPVVDESFEEPGFEPALAGEAAGGELAASDSPGRPAGAFLFQEQSPEKMEQVLNAGMSFISGLMEMATGRKMENAGQDGRMVRIDAATGEVTLKFKLPGF